MIFAQAFLKFSAFGVTMALLVLLIRDGRRLSVFPYAVLLLLALSCLLLTTGHTSIAINPPWAIPLRLFDIFSIVFVWWFALALFEDGFKLRWIHYLGAICYGLILAFDRTAYYGFHDGWLPNMAYLSTAIAVLMMLQIGWVALVGRQDDLVEARRRMRVRFAISLGLLIIVTSMMERLAKPLGYSPFLSMLVIYAVSLLLGLWAILWLTRLQAESLDFLAAHEKSPAPSITESSDYQRLIHFLEIEKGYRDNNLSIGKLAEAIDLPPHQLRQLINQGLGYRNYTAFLNHFRLQDIKQALADPQQIKTPILTIALDAGFSSLAPFNRAFKEAEGLTPTEFRKQALEQGR